MIPGINLLKLAGTVIGMQKVRWFQFQERVTNGRGQWVNKFADPVDIQGSWQPVGEQAVKDLGLDTSKRYFNLYTPHPVENVQRGVAPDQIVYDGRLHDVVGNKDWYTQDGWRGIMCVDIGAYDEPKTP